MADDLITRLCDAVHNKALDIGSAWNLLEEASEQLSALRLRVKELEGERDELRQILRDASVIDLEMEEARLDVRRRAEAAESEARRLREALQYIALRGDETAMAAIHHTPEGSAG